MLFSTTEFHLSFYEKFSGNILLEYILSLKNNCIRNS